MEHVCDAGELEQRFLADAPDDPWRRGYAELELIKECERQIAALHAVQAKAMARFIYCRPESPRRPIGDFVADEIGLAAGWTTRTAELRLGVAYALTDRLPATLAALERGEIDWRRAENIANATRCLDPDLAADVEAAVLPDAPGQNAPQVARAARKAVARLDPEGDADRHAEAKTERRVEVYPLPDAMAGLYAVLPAADALRIHDTLDAYARDAAGTDDPRTMDQRRADAFVDVFLGRAPQRKGGAQIHVTVAASTLLGVDDQPGELAGYGPIPAQLARDIAADGTWRRLLTDPASGALLDFGRTTYRPPVALADFVRARDQYCVFPGCGRRAKYCDLDHCCRYPDGPTAECNLACLCRRHHRLKHEGDWTVERHGDRFVWTSRTRYEYTRKPEPIAEPPPPKPQLIDIPAPF